MAVASYNSGPGVWKDGWTLAIESSTAQGSAAVLHHGEPVAEAIATLGGGRRDSERLMPAVARVLATAGVEPRQLNKVVCGAGPGSFTGLRIGAAIGKGIAHACSIPMHAVSSLLLVGAEAAMQLGDGLYLVVVDALRDERYVLHTESAEGRTTAVGNVRLLPMAAVDLELQSGGLKAVGPDVGGVFPHARGVARCWEAIGPPVELGPWEPLYGRKAEAQARWESTHGRSLADA